MKRILAFISILTALVITYGCGKDDAGSTTTSSDISDAVESGVNAAAAMADEQGNQSFAQMKMKLTGSQRALAALEDILLPKNAYAAACWLQQRAVNQTCTDQGSYATRSVLYEACTLGLGSMSGSVVLTYSSDTCDMSTTGNFVTRTAGVILTGPRGGYLTTSSDSNTTYDGQTVGGGQKLTKTSGGHEIEILGVHKTLQTPGGTKLFDFNVKTPTPLSVTGGLARGVRTITSGAVQVIHNLAQFTATHTFSNVAWGDASCCYPTSGTISTAFSGTNPPATSASVAFSVTCGSATLTVDGSSSSITLSNCD